MQRNQSGIKVLRWQGLYFSNWGWLTPLALLVTAILMAASVSTYHHRADFADNSLPLQVEVIGEQAIEGGDGQRVNLLFNYDIPPSATVSMVEVSKTFSDQHPKGSMIEVYYLPTEPWPTSMHKTGDREDGNWVYILTLLAGLFTITSFVFSRGRAIAALKRL